MVDGEETPDGEASRELAGPAEEERVAAMRDALTPELAELAARGHDFPHTTGDVFLLRVLRGHNGNVDRALAWYRTCLARRRELGLDEIFLRELRHLPFDLTQLPGYNEVCAHFKMLGDEASLRTPGGDIVICEFMGATSWQVLLEKVGIDKMFQWQLRVHEAKLAALDRQSRERGRLVKFVALVDVRDISFPPRDFIDLETKLKAGIFEETGIEVVHRVLVLGGPRWLHSVWRAVSPLVPRRTRRDVRLVGYNFTKDPQALAVAGAPLLATVAAFRCTAAGAGSGDGEDDGLDGRGRLVLAGGAFERGVPVVAGERVSWKFQIGDRNSLAEVSARGLVGNVFDAFRGATDLVFGVSAVWDPEEDGEDTEQPSPSEAPVEAPMEGVLVDVVAPVKVDATAGEVVGSVVAERGGIVVLRWSNCHSWLRAQILADFHIVVTGAGDRDGGGSVAAAAPA